MDGPLRNPFEQAIWSEAYLARLAWTRAIEAVTKRDRAAMAHCIVDAHSHLGWIQVRQVRLPKKVQDDLALVLGTLRILLLGCIGEGGLDHIDDLQAAVQACEKLGWWTRYRQ